MIGGQLSPPQSFPNASDEHFEMTIWLKIVERSDYKNYGVDKTPPGPGGRRWKLCPGGIHNYYGRDSRINFRNSSFD